MWQKKSVYNGEYDFRNHMREKIIQFIIFLFIKINLPTIYFVWEWQNCAQLNNEIVSLQIYLHQGNDGKD